MLIIFIVIGLLILSFGMLIWSKGDKQTRGIWYELYDNDIEECCWVIGGFLLIVSCIAGLTLLILVSFGPTLQSKITMYEEENAAIEQQVETVVLQYMDYERTTFKECSSSSYITLVDLYPELKTDTLVSKQIDVYLSNNSKIKELKEELLELGIYKWWLYFGN